jgi:hypothetical protein
MKTLHKTSVAVIVIFLLQASVRAGVLTLLAGESYQLGSNDVAEVLSVLPGNMSLSFSTVPAVILVDGKPIGAAFSYANAGFFGGFAAPQPVVIAGPRTISSLATNSVWYIYSLVTLRITDKVSFEQSRSGSCPALTAVIPNDPGSFNVVMEASSDLITWNPALPGSYGGGGSNRFFRVRIERKP